MNEEPKIAGLSNLFCADLPSAPRKDMGTILVTGASGYIGGRLVPELIARGYRVRVMVRGSSREYSTRWRNAEVAVADALDKQSLSSALDGVDTAYYLIHSLLLGLDKFARADIQAASNFREAAEKNGVKNIIYLGGLGDCVTSRSRQGQCRMDVAEELRKGTVPVTILRAAIIIGSGSASYEIIRGLVSKVPLIFIPHWARNECQPIAIRDVIKYLVGVLEAPNCAGKSYDIGGKDILTYENMMRIFAEVVGKKVVFLPAPFSNIPVYSYMASLLTPVPAMITACLMEGLKDEVVCREDDITGCIDFEPLSYRDAIVRALTREEQDRVDTRWSDAYPPAHELAQRLHEVEGGPQFTATYFLESPKSAAKIFRSTCTIGGATGWFNNNWLWRARGGMDRIIFGVGTARGRKSLQSLKIGDVIDFWRVEDIERDRGLLLRAEMRIPGQAWLEFNISEKDGKRILSVTAFFHTKSIWGKLYWYFTLLLHHFIFRDLIEQIEKRA